MKLLILLLLVALFPVAGGMAHRNTKRSSLLETKGATAAAARTTTDNVVISGQTAGATPFNAQIQLVVTPADSLRTLRFTISPKPGSVTRPISATYTSEHMQDRGYLNTNTGTANVPVFGLYSGYANTVTLDFTFADGSSQQEIVTVNTAAYTETCGYTTPTIVQARTNSTSLSYDYILVKTHCGMSATGPHIVDTDGQIRWLGTAPIGGYAYIFFDNSIFMASGPASAGRTATALTRLEFDGTFSQVADYAGMGVTWSGHHNYDPGKQGILIEVDTTTQVESVIHEIDECGTILKTWNLADIIRNTIIAGGENPASFVRNVSSPPSANDDWFHNNAVAYWKSDDSLIVSSRENFVICIDYNTGAIKWILGDTTKHWHDFQSLRNYQLTLTPGSLPPIGQHAVSITNDNNLLLFDDGANSLHQTPAGTNRNYSAVRKYHIDPQAKIATEVYTYLANPSLYSSFCSSVYEDAPGNYLVDYSLVGDFLGLDAAGNKIFHYKYRNCDASWNQVPIHLESLYFPGPNPATDPRGWQVNSFYRQGSKVVVNFRAMAGKTYRTEYKDSPTDASWQTVTDSAVNCTGFVAVTDTPATDHRVYRVREL